MKKFLWYMIIAMTLGKILNAGEFSVCQYNLSRKPSSITDAVNLIESPAEWDGSPVNATYHTISLANNPYYPNDQNTHIIFPTCSFPGWKDIWNNYTGARISWFATKIVGKINIPRKGYWSFAMGHDDGFICKISHGSHQFSFSAEGDTWFSGERKISVFDFSESGPGIYDVEIIHYQQGGPAFLEFSMAEGSFTTFDASKFQLVEATDEAVSYCVIHFNANGGVGEMGDMSVNRDLVLPTLFPELADSIDLPYPTGFIAPPSNSHKFIGWGLSADVDGVNNPESLVKTTNDLRNHFLQNDLPSNGIIPLFAIWGKFFTVQFDANGGIGTMTPQTFFDGKRQKLSKNAYAKGSNVFIGWAVSSNDAEKGLVKYFDEDEFPDDDSDNSDKTLYAVWTTSVTVSFYNQEDKTLKPTSLGDYMRWKVEGESIGVWHRPGEFKELEPGKYYKFLFDVTEMEWMVWPKTSEKVVYVTGASAFNSTTLLAGESFQYTVLAEVDVEGGAGPSVFFECHAEKISGQTFDPSTVRIRLEYHGPDGGRQSTAYSGFLANEWYKLPWGIYNVSAETTDGKWIAYPIYNLNLTSGTDNIRKIALDFFYRNEGDSLSGVEIRLDPNAMGAKVDPNVLNVYAHYERSWMQVPRLPTPKYVLHEFKGWWTEPEGGKKVEEGERIDCIIEVLYAHWEFRITIDWLSSFPSILDKSNGDVTTAAAMTAANGCRTVGECYALGINPEDPNDDLKITDFKMNGDTANITVNHTVDGSGNSFVNRIRTFGKKSLMDADWVDVTGKDQSEYRFFKVVVDVDDGGGSGGDVN